MKISGLNYFGKVILSTLRFLNESTNLIKRYSRKNLEPDENETISRMIMDTLVHRSHKLDIKKLQQCEFLS